MVSLWRRLSTPFRLTLIALLALLTCGPGVIAESGESGATFFVRERQRQDQQFKVLNPSRPVAQQPRQKRRPNRAPVAPIEHAARSPDRPPPSFDKPAPSYFVAVMGDSLGVLLHQGLQETFADRPEIAFLRKARESSGLVREDFYNWPKSVADMLNGPEHIDLAIMLIGSNDRQALRDGGQDVEPLSPRWREIYAGRVDALANLFRDRHIKLIWVGLPVMKVEKMSLELAELNEIYRQSAGRTGALYIDIWDAFVNDSGKYDVSGPDVNGAIVKLRTIDGIHFTKSGQRKLAHFVEAEVRRGFDAAKPSSAAALAALMPEVGPLDKPASIAGPANPPLAPAPTSAAPIPDAADLDLNALIRRQMNAPEPAPATPVTPEASLQSSLVLPPEPPPLFVPVKPAAGKVTLLTALPLAASGELARRRTASAWDGESQSLINQAFRQGRLPPPPPGRADAFEWAR